MHLASRVRRIKESRPGWRFVLGGLTAALLGLGSMGLASAARGDVIGEVTPYEGTALLSPLDDAYPLVDELFRTAHRDGTPFPVRPPSVGEFGWTTLSSAGKTTSTVDWTGHPAERLLARWARARPGPRTLGFSIRPEMTLVVLGTEPRRQLRPPYLDVREGEAVDPALRALVGFRADANFLASLSGHFRYTFDTDGQNNPRNRTPDFDQIGTSNNIDEAYVRWQSNKVALLLGRAPLAFGPERLGPLALSATAPALDLMHGTLRWGSHRLQFFAGQLSSETVATADGEDAPLHHKRYLYGHRLDLWFGRWRLGFDELALVAGPNESLSLRYLNPVQFYTQVQTEENGDAASQVNVLLSVDTDLFIRRFHVYGSFVVDDLQIDREGRERNPHQLAWAAGTDWSPAVDSPWWLAYAYRRVGTWTYLHSGQATTYRQFSRPLGAPEGPDTDRHVLLVSRRFGSGWRILAEGEHRRRGENRITTEESRTGHAGEPYPSGQVESRWIGTLGVELAVPPYAHALLTAAYQSVKNVNNTAEDEDILEVRLELRLRAPALAWQVRDANEPSR